MSTPIGDPTALADQIDAAARHARHLVTRMAAAGLGQLTDAVGHPWLTGQAAALVHALSTGTGRACPHLGPTPAVIHAAVWAPGRVVCPACVGLLRAGPVEDSTCDRCRRHVRRLHAGAAAFGPLILAYGLCRACATATGLAPTEQHAPAGQHRQTVTNRRPPRRRPVRHQRR
jgi:hypothetical protein